MSDNSLSDQSHPVERPLGLWKTIGAWLKVPPRVPRVIGFLLVVWLVVVLGVNIFNLTMPALPGGTLWGWTGFPGNSMWDWLNLLLVPGMLGIATTVYTHEGKWPDHSQWGKLWVKMKNIWMWKWQLSVVVAAVLLVSFIVAAYILKWTWTGLIEWDSKNQVWNYKALWDWITLLLLPGGLAAATIWGERYRESQHMPPAEPAAINP